MVNNVFSISTVWNILANVHSRKRYNANWQNGRLYTWYTTSQFRRRIFSRNLVAMSISLFRRRFVDVLSTSGSDVFRRWNNVDSVPPNFTTLKLTLFRRRVILSTFYRERCFDETNVVSTLNRRPLISLKFLMKTFFCVRNLWIYYKPIN